MSEAVIHDGIVYLAGQIAEDATQDIGRQTRQALAAIDAPLAEAGTDKARGLTAQIFLADMPDFAGMNAVRDAWVPTGQTPARNAAGQARKPDWKIGLVVTAALR